MIHELKGEQEITDCVRQYTPGIREDGSKKVLAGVTTLEEVLRVTQKD